MYLVALFVVSAIVLVWICTTDMFMRIIFSIMGGAIAAATALLVSLMILHVYPHNYAFNEEDRAGLVAFSNISGIEGRFFLASGSFESKHSYVFFYKTGDGGKRFGKLDASAVVIYEEKREDGYLARRRVMPDKESPVYRQWRWAIPSFLYEKYAEEQLGVFWAMHVPEGTVLKEFRVDLKNFNR